MKKLERIAITGATSTIGIALIQLCVENKIEVIAFTRESSTRNDLIPKNELVYIQYCPLEEMNSFDVGELSADCLVHLAWKCTSKVQRNDTFSQLENVKYSLDAVDLAKRLGCKRFIGAGSQAEYGRKNVVIDESTSINPETPYGIAKFCASKMTQIECQKNKIEHIWARIFSVYGPNCQKASIVNYVIECLLSNKRPSLSSCEQRWDFLFTKDVAKMILGLANKGVDGETYCLASGESRTLKTFIDEISAILNSDVEIGYGDISSEEGMLLELQADISKLMSTIEYFPQFSFENGIKETIDWIREREI